MAQFLGDIAFLFEMVLLAGGLVLLHRGRQEGSGLLRVAAIVLLLAGAAGALCTTYFWFRYHGQGDFDRAYPMATASMTSGATMKPPGGAMMPDGRQGWSHDAYVGSLRGPTACSVSSAGGWEYARRGTVPPPGWEPQGRLGGRRPEARGEDAVVSCTAGGKNEGSSGIVAKNPLHRCAHPA